MKRKYTLEEVKEKFANHGWKCLSDEYINNRTKMKCVCKCGEALDISLQSFLRNKKRCSICSALDQRYSLDEAKEIFLQYGFILLAKKYNSNKTLMEYECRCGEKSKITLSSVMANQSCHKCWLEAHSGENCNFYNPDLTDEERKIREENRNVTTKKYRDWRSEVYQRDNYICQFCEDSRGSNLNAHHKNGWFVSKDERYEVSNGITFCDRCHKEFHRIFGYGGNTFEQCEEFLNPISVIF